MSEDGKTKYTVQRRRIAWSIMSHSRIMLKISIHPHISTAFLMLHKYYQRYPNTEYGLLTLITSSIFVSCKSHEDPHSMQSIYSALLYCSRNLSKKSTPEFISAILETNNLDEKKIPDVEVDQINKCELDLLESLDFKLDYKLPFDYVDQYVRPYLSKLDLEIQKNLQNKLPCNLCVILCSERCINYPAEIMAVAATINSFENIPFPEEIFQWISFEREKFGASEIDNVCLLLREELDAIASK